MSEFCHLHCHTQFSLLDGAAPISGMFAKAAADGMPAVAMTDHGNLFGAFAFVAEANKHKGIKPIIGCEFYLVQDRHKRQFTKEEKDKRYHQVFLAKNAVGYHNLVKMCSLGYIEGLYGKYPRIDKELVQQYHEGLIATTCCIGASVPQAILKLGEDEAEKEFLWWLNIFQGDFYVEIQRHHMPEQEKVNEVLLRFAAKHNVPIICSNDSHYLDRDDYNAHDILLCVNTGEKQSTPVFKDFDDNTPIPHGSRFGFFNDEFYFKTTAEMQQLFYDLPQAVTNTVQVADKCDHLNLIRDVMLPNFPVPPAFASQEEYLEHLTYEGARRRYGEITEVIRERIDFELFTIKSMGYAGYFLIVADFIKAGREMGVFVGPGRGSAAGSVVAYCLDIINIDPIKYNLLFERFLNPDRKSLPDIDIDFDDEGRQKVIDYVVEKYGKQQVAHIVTYSSMAAKTSIKDVARVLDLPLDRANALAKKVPDKPGISLHRLLHADIDGPKGLREKENLSGEDIDAAMELRAIFQTGSEEGRVLREALRLEGSVRGTGIHAAGIIIAPTDLTDLIPVCTQKDVHLPIAQFEGGVIEQAGVIKMDFLGLRTLTIIRDALQLIKDNHGIDIVLDDIPLDDAKTYELYQKAETNGTFQFESAGMQKYLRELKPDKFDDLIAMNALYRPGPMDYIPSYINRKHGREPITYDLPEAEEYLEPTYGIAVYQEQIMLLSQKLADFTRGDADTLRKAMGKKKLEEIKQLKTKFMDNALAKGLPADKLEKIWTDWEAFASYAFNKSHSTCYALVAYQTGYLKAHYPAEYMAAVLTNHLGQIDKITFFMEECRRLGVQVKGPDVNESGSKFAVNKNGEIRYALSAIKGVGEGVVEQIVDERKSNGLYTSVYDFMRRSNTRTLNKKVLEALVHAGALDCFGHDRAVYFEADARGQTFIEALLRYAQAYQSQKESNQNSLFGSSTESITLPEPSIPRTEPWSLVERLERERDVVGIFLSGHPLDDFKTEISNFAKDTIAKVIQLKPGVPAKFAAFVTKVERKISKRGSEWGRLQVQDYSNVLEISLFGEQYAKFKHLLEEGRVLYIAGSNQQRPYGDESVEFKVSEIRQIEELGLSMTEQITVHLPIDLLNSELLDKLANLCNSCKGPHTLRFMLLDNINKQALLLKSAKYKVLADGVFIGHVERLGLECKIN